MNDGHTDNYKSSRETINKGKMANPMMTRKEATNEHPYIRTD